MVSGNSLRTIFIVIKQDEARQISSVSFMRVSLPRSRLQNLLLQGMTIFLSGVPIVHILNSFVVFPRQSTNVNKK